MSINLASLRVVGERFAGKTTPFMRDICPSPLCGVWRRSKDLEEQLADMGASADKLNSLNKDGRDLDDLFKSIGTHKHTAIGRAKR